MEWFAWIALALGAVLAVRGVPRSPAGIALAGATLAMGVAAWTTRSPVAAILAGQLLAASLGSGAKRRSLVLPLLGHATLLVAAFLVWRAGGVPPTAALALASGFTILALHAFWARGADQGWEGVLLAGVVAGLAAGVLRHAGLAAVAVLLALAALARPPRAPAWMRLRRSVVTDVLAHGVAATSMVNVFFLAYSLVAAWSVRVILGLILLWSFVGIQMEYRNLANYRKALARGDVQPRPRPLPDPPVPITVVVPAANEADVLPGSLAKNLAVPYPLSFLLVPALKSKDATVEVAHRSAAAHPDRVRVLEGTSGSKAEDLNAAWREVGTDVVLILDADETIDADSLAHGLDLLLADPKAGVVQGRKVSSAPEESALARFISVERRYSTGMDTVMHAQQFGSTHFGGSAALFRRQAAVDLGGWTTRSMTEDIDFTLRAHLDGRWMIRYEPRMVVRESDPRNVSELLKQRVRWSRGWIQCVGAYLPGVVAKRRDLGLRRATGLTWMLLTCVAALWTTLFPATVLLRLAGFSLLMPVKVALLIALLMLPARVLSYGYGALKDPVIPVPRRVGRFAEFVLHAYLWIPFGWLVSMHSLYQELFQAPRVWYVTGKKGGGAAPAAARSAPT